MKVKIILALCLAVILTILLVSVIQKPGPDDPKIANKHFSEGKSLFNQGNLKDAIRAYKKGLRYNPRSSEGYNLLGMVYRHQYGKQRKDKYLKRAIKAFKKSIALDAKNWYPLVNLGTTHFYLGDKKDSIEYLEKSIDVYPQNPEAAKLMEMIEKAKKEK